MEIKFTPLLLKTSMARLAEEAALMPA